MENKREDFKRFKVQEFQYMNMSSREKKTQGEEMRSIIQEKYPKLKEFPK